MGIALLLSFGIYVCLFIALIRSVFISASRCRAIQIYWIISIISAVAIPFLLVGHIPHRSHGEFGGMATFVEEAFSKTNLVYFFGAIFSEYLSRKTGDLQLLSGLCWGFAVSFVVRLFLVLVA
jgi:hypothetical protein